MIKEVKLGKEPLENIENINSNFSELSSSINNLKPGQPGGVATLDESGKLNRNQLPLIDLIPIEDSSVIYLDSFSFELPASAPDGTWGYRTANNKLYLRKDGAWTGPFEPSPSKLYLWPQGRQMYYAVQGVGLMPLIFQFPNLETLLMLETSDDPFGLAIAGDPMMQKYRDFWEYKDITSVRMVSGMPTSDGKVGDAAYDSQTKLMYLYGIWGWEVLRYDIYTGGLEPYLIADFVEKNENLIFLDKSSSKLYSYTADYIRDGNNQITKIEVTLHPLN